MQVRALANTSSLETFTLHATGGAAVLWLGVLVREWPRLVAYGQMCGEETGLFGHCALCWPAAALTAAATIGAARLLFGGPTEAASAARRPGRQPRA